MALTLTLPLALADDGRLGTLVQDSAADLAQSIGLILATRPGERLAAPEYGFTDALGAGVRTDHLLDAVRANDDRVDQLDVEVLGKLIQAVSVTDTITNTPATAGTS